MESKTRGHVAKGTTVIHICLVVLATHGALNALAAPRSTQAAGSQLPQLMDRQRGIALALSACFGPVASKAVGEGSPHALIIVPVGGHTDEGHTTPEKRPSGSQ